MVGQIMIIIFIAYVIGFVIFVIIDTCGGIREKYDRNIMYLVVYPVIPFLELYILFQKLNNYLTKNNLKKMNAKILMKAMSFMFLPSLGVLLMLLIGFFDPIALWTFIKSDNGWAIFLRIFMTICELVLITIMYFQYLDEDTKKGLLSNGTSKLKALNIDGGYSRVNDLFKGKSNSEDEYKYYKTESDNLILIEKTPKES